MRRRTEQRGGAMSPASAERERLSRIRSRLIAQAIHMTDSRLSHQERTKYVLGANEGQYDPNERARLFGAIMGALRSDQRRKQEAAMAEEQSVRDAVREQQVEEAKKRLLREHRRHPEGAEEMWSPSDFEAAGIEPPEDSQDARLAAK